MNIITTRKIIDNFNEHRFNVILAGPSKELLISPLSKESKNSLENIISKFNCSKVEWEYNGTIAIQFNNFEDGMISTGDFNIYKIDNILHIIRNSK